MCVCVCVCPSPLYVSLFWEVGVAVSFISWRSDAAVTLPDGRVMGQQAPQHESNRLL